MSVKKPELFGLCEYTFLDLEKVDDAPYEIDKNMLMMAKRIQQKNSTKWNISAVFRLIVEGSLL